MPSATDEVRAAVDALFPESDDVCVASVQFLSDAGFVFCNHGTICPPSGHIVSDEEGACLDYLWQEWDYGYGEKCEGCRG